MNQIHQIHYFLSILLFPRTDNQKKFLESAKLRTPRALLSYVPCASSALVPQVSRALRALVPCVLLRLTCLVPYVLSCLACLVSHVSCALFAYVHSCFRNLFMSPYVPLASRALRTLCANITFCALEFLCLTFLYFYSFSTCDFFWRIY